MNNENFDWYKAQSDLLEAARLADDDTETGLCEHGSDTGHNVPDRTGGAWCVGPTVQLVSSEEYEQSITATKERELRARDNEAYRRDFPEADRWADDGGYMLDVNTYGGEPKSIYFPRPNTLGELLDRNLDLQAPVAEDARVLVFNERHSDIIIVTKGNE